MSLLSFLIKLMQFKSNWRCGSVVHFGPGIWVENKLDQHKPQDKLEI